MSLTAEEHTLPLPIGDIDLEKKAEELGIEYFLPCISTLTNTDLRGSLIPRCGAKKLQQSGFNIHVFEFYGTELNLPECYCVPDPSTLIQLPWNPKIGWLACNLYYRGKPFEKCPRRALIRLTEEAKQKGYVLKTGIEPEFILLKKESNEPVDKEEDFHHYHSPLAQMGQETFLTEVLSAMDKLGWEPYQAEHEAAASQYEINFGYADMLTTADRHLFLKFMVKDIARKQGYRATFMPMPFPGFLGNGFHVHVSIWSADEDKNLVPDAGGEMEISDVARQFLAGLLKHSEGMAAIMCPTVNSYKRVHNAEHLLNAIAYGKNSRWNAYRVVEDNRFEIRTPDASSNPYLLQAAILVAGMDGIENKIELDPKERMDEDLMLSYFPTPSIKPTPDHIRKLPRNLQEAAKKLGEDEQLMAKIGPPIIGTICFMKAFEWESFMRPITEFELNLIGEY